MKSQNDTRPDSQKPRLVEGFFYLKALFVCSECGYKEDVSINYDTEVYHECNSGNRRTLVPELKLPTKSTTHVKLLKGK
jgi:hypothetical protein